MKEKTLTCKYCGKTKPVHLFHSTLKCIMCRNKDVKKYRQEHKEYFREYGKKWRKKHPGYFKAWLKKNPDYFKKVG